MKFCRNGTPQKRVISLHQTASLESSTFQIGSRVQAVDMMKKVEKIEKKKTQKLQLNHIG
jgi:sulfate adenylyltransferase subunit 1 (EFTu-like GTPase family)